MAEKLTFEEALNRLEAIITQLETGEYPLSESLSLYEEGAKLMKQCTGMLDKAEQKVTKLCINAMGEVTEDPFVPKSE